MSLFKGSSTLLEYEECLKRGLCEEHVKEISQNEPAVVNEEFPRKAFQYIRINILYPLLFKKSPKLEKIKKLMEKTPALSKILFGGDISEAANVIFILDSVIIFTLCQLSQICCIGALFHIKKKIPDDAGLKCLHQLLIVDQLDKKIVNYLYPTLQKNFVGCDTDILKASHIITLIFVRNFCTKFNMKTAIENIEKDIKGDESWKNFKDMGDSFYNKEKFKEASSSYTSALFQNLYSHDIYCRLADCHLHLKNYKAAQLYSYLALSMKSTYTEAYCQFVTSLTLQKQYSEAEKMVQYALEVCDNSNNFYSSLKILHKEIENCLNKRELSLDVMKSSCMSNSTEKKTTDKYKSLPVQLIDSDSEESEDDCNINIKQNTSEIIDCSEEHKAVKPVVNTQDKTKSKPSVTTKKKRTVSEGLTDVPVDEEIDDAKINAFLKEASEALLADCGYKAVQIFRGPLRVFMESHKLLSLEECDIVCIKYSFAIAYCKSGGLDDLQRCINILKDIIENHDSVTFPAAYYSIGLAYRKLNKFKESLNYLEIVQDFLCKGIHFKVYPWPGMTTVIPETKPDVLKDLVQDLTKECVNPPNPDALCRYLNCEFQPSIYYTDPDFKGYVSLFCSEQCCMQYHFLCWKAIKTEKLLQDKDFLEKACFTPDCEGVIVKIHNIDKKGHLSKEFTSDIKKHLKQKWAKWEKKSEIKEKKRKKVNGKAEEIPDGRDRRNSSTAGDESASVNSISSSSENSTHFSESSSVVEDNKEPSTTKEGQEMEPDVYSDEHINSDINFCSSSENSIQLPDTSPVVENNKEIDDGNQFEKHGPEFQLNECIKNNVYSFMYDFLQHHGPLKVDDPILIDEIESFPDEVHLIISKHGGIGEFLKEDLRFAYVGDMYVCVIDDLATAYQLGSSSCIPTDFKSLQSLGGTEGTKCYTKSSSEAAFQNIGLNPDAMEYTPSSINKSNSLSQNFNLDCPVFEPSPVKDVYQTSNTSLDNFSQSELHKNKSTNSDAYLNKNSENLPELVFHTPEHPRTSNYHDNSDSGKSECTYQPSPSSELSNPDYTVTNGSVSKNIDKNNVLENSDLKFQLMKILKIYYSEEMKSHRQKIDSYIKPFVVKKIPNLSVSATMTDFELVGNFTKVDALSEQNISLNNKLEAATLKQKQLTSEVAQLKKLLKENEMQREKLLDGRKYLLESLTSSHETIDNQKQKLAVLTEEKNGLQKTLDILTLSLKKNDEKMKSALDAKEKHLNTVILNFQNEIDELKNRAKHAELQVLHLKKTEYLKKIEEKCAEATKRRKELTDGLSIISSSCNLNPVVQSNMKILSTQLLSYVNILSAIKKDFVKAIDEEIEKVKGGTALKEIKELKMKELPEIPCMQSLFPANGPVLGKPLLNSNQLPYNFGLNMGASHQVPSSAFNSTFTMDAPMISGTKIPPTAAIVPPTPLSSKSNTSSKTEINKGSMDFAFNPQIEESFKSAMASINSFASTPYVAPPLDDEFHKKCAVLKHPDPVPINKPDVPKVPPSVQDSTSHAASEKTFPKDKIPEASVPTSFNKEKRIDTLDVVPLVNSESTQSTWDLEKKKVGSSRNSYEKLLCKLKDHFPQYNQVELMSFVKEFRAQRQGKLTGLTMDTIISKISDLIMEKKLMEKKISEAKAIPKTAKVLVNKKLVPDPKPPSISEQQNVKKKTAWGNVDSEKRFSGTVEDDCVICREAMTQLSTYTGSCGHIFHELCIREWLRTKNDCPICRTLLLLPEEYPSLP